MEITEEMQAAIDAAVEAATEKLKTKNSELIAEVRTLKTAKTAAEQAAEDAAEQAATKAGDVEAIKTQLNTKHASAITALEAKLTAVNENYAKLVIDDAIMSNMVAANVPAHLHAPLKAFFKSDAKLGDDGVAMIGDTTLADYLPAYFQSDEGKSYTLAPQNVGTGVTGVRNSSAQGHGFTRENFSTRTAEWGMLASKEPERARQIALDVGREDLARTLGE